MKVYERLANYIRETGIKQSYVAEKSGIPENTLSMILHGTCRLDAYKVEDIIIALNIEPSLIILPIKKSTTETSDTN